MRLDIEGIILDNGVNVRLIASKKTCGVRKVKWLVADKTVITGWGYGFGKHYIRVRPKYGFGSYSMTTEEVEAVASSIIDIRYALQEPAIKIVGL